RNKPVETAKGVYRFEWKIDANKVVEEAVTELLVSDEANLLTGLTTHYLTRLAEADATSKPVRDAILAMLKLRASASAAGGEASSADAKVKLILSEQDRIRNHIYH